MGSTQTDWAKTGPVQRGEPPVSLFAGVADTLATIFRRNTPGPEQSAEHIDIGGQAARQQKQADEANEAQRQRAEEGRAAQDARTSQPSELAAGFTDAAGGDLKAIASEIASGHTGPGALFGVTFSYPDFKNDGRNPQMAAKIDSIIETVLKERDWTEIYVGGRANPYTKFVREALRDRLKELQAEKDPQALQRMHLTEDEYMRLKQMRMDMTPFTKKTLLEYCEKCAHAGDSAPLPKDTQAALAVQTAQEQPAPVPAAAPGS